MTHNSTTALTRRAFLTGGAAASVGALSLLAGCLDGITGANPTTQTTPTTVTTTQTTPTTAPTTTQTTPTTTTQTTQPTETETETPGSTLTTYTNERYGYRISYPADWTVYDSDPQYVVIRSSTGYGDILFGVFETTQQYTLDEVVTGAIQGTREQMNAVTVVGEHDTTLKSGQQAHVIDASYDNPNDSVGLIRSKYLVTVQGMTVYQVEYRQLKTEYTAAVDRVATRIIESFAITGQAPTETSTGTPTETSTEAPPETSTNGQTALDLTPQTTYTNDAYGYRITYPANWLVYDSSLDTVEFVNRDDDTLRVLVSDVAESTTATSYVDSIIASIKQEQTAVKVLDRHTTTLSNGNQAQVFYLTHDVPDDQYGQLRSYSLVTKQDGMMYDVHFIADDADWTPTVERAVEQMLTSLTLTPPPALSLR